MTRQKRVVGDVVEIPLGDGTCAYARVLKKPLMAFYDHRFVVGSRPSLSDIVAKPVAFKIWVMNRAVTDGLWPVIGNVPLKQDLCDEPWFYKQDSISGLLFRMRHGSEIAATKEECIGLEAAAAWSRCHVVDRLRDRFAGRMNKWVESMRIK